MSLLSHLDPCTNQYELEVRKIIYLQNITNQLPDACVNAMKVTKSHIAVANVPSKIDIPTQQVVINEFRTRQKRDRPIGSKDKNPQKKIKSINLIKDVDILEEI